VGGGADVGLEEIMKVTISIQRESNILVMTPNQPYYEEYKPNATWVWIKGKKWLVEYGIPISEVENDPHYEEYPEDKNIIFHTNPFEHLAFEPNLSAQFIKAILAKIYSRKKFRKAQIEIQFSDYKDLAKSDKALFEWKLFLERKYRFSINEKPLRWPAWKSYVLRITELMLLPTGLFMVFAVNLIPDFHTLQENMYLLLDAIFSRIYLFIPALTKFFEFLAFLISGGLLIFGILFLGPYFVLLPLLFIFLGPEISRMWLTTD
jgi:hypothetical protein